MIPVGLEHLYDTDTWTLAHLIQAMVRMKVSRICRVFCFKQLEIFTLI